jgi:hypothetical protein
MQAAEPRWSIAGNFSSLAYVRHRSDESSCAEPALRGITTMNTNAEATATNRAAAVAEQGAQGMPDKAAPKKDASKKKSAPKGQKPAKRKAKAAATKKTAPPAKKAAKATASKESTTMRPESKGAKVLALISRLTWRALPAPPPTERRSSCWSTAPIRARHRRLPAVFCATIRLG